VRVAYVVDEYLLWAHNRWCRLAWTETYSMSLEIRRRRRRFI